MSVPRNWIGILLALGVIIVMLAMIVHAFAHSSYPVWCCNGNNDNGDCRPVPCEQISENSDGSYTWNGIKFAPAMVVPSFNKECHVCEATVTDANGHSEHFPHCIFLRWTA